MSAELNVGYVALATGRVEEARLRAQARLAFSRERGLQFTEILALRLLAQCLVMLPTPDAKAAIGHLEDALNLTRVMGTRPGEGVTRLILAGMLAKIGQASRGREEATGAARIFDSLGMAAAAARARGLFAVA